MSTVLNEKKVALESSSKVWNYGLWTAQVLLGFSFGMAGFMKLMTPIEQLAIQMAWVTTVPVFLVKFIGLSEFLGALGLILPSVTRIKPYLTSFAGLGLATVMLLASLFHLTRGELAVLPVNVVLGSIALLIAYGRSKKVLIESK